MRGRARDLRATQRFKSGARRWVTPVVVLWADFPERRAEHDGVTYIHGDELEGWYRSLTSANAARPELALVRLVRRAC
jgi:hypothetical protein